MGEKLGAETANIMIVDDNVMNIAVFQAMLTEMNQKSDKALNGKEALQLVPERIEKIRAGEQVQMYTLLIVDYNMPVVDGPQFARTVRKLLVEEGMTIPYICCCSAYAEESYKRVATAVGMKQFLTKPVSDDELRKLLVQAGLHQE